MKWTLSLVVSTLVLVPLALSSSADAVVGGDPTPPSRAPWFAATGICGGALIAPDRVATAAHCFDPVDVADLERISVGGQTRRGVRVALPAGWETQRAGFALHDVAIVQLDRPVRGVAPAAVTAAGARVPAQVTVLGRGQIHAPRPGKRAASGLFSLRRATLRTLADGDCARRWARSRTKYRTRFAAATDVCALGSGSPRRSVCAGDSGGPMITGTLARPVLLGVISWTGPRCGADGLPSVAVDARAFRAFLLDPAPVWAPVPAGSAQVRGEPRVGATLTCELPAWEVAPERVEIRWIRRVRSGRRFVMRRVGTGATYVARGADAGHLLDCQAMGSGAGGRTRVPLAPGSAVRVG